MVPLSLEEAWSMYALDMRKKILNVLDPVLTWRDDV
jgi:hypothetical protein